MDQIIENLQIENKILLNPVAGLKFTGKHLSNNSLATFRTNSRNYFSK